MWDGLGMGVMDLFNRQNITEGALIAGAAAGGVMLGAWALPQIPWVKDDPKYKAIAAILAGFVGGHLLMRQNREAGYGLMAGLGGLGIASLVSQYTGTGITLADIGEDDDYEMDEELESPVVSTEQLSYLGQPEDEALLGMGDAVVQQEMLAGGFEQAVVSTEDELGSWLT
jgi:hypothetical protein